MSIEVKVDQYINVNESEPIVVDVSNEAYKVNADPLPDSVLINDSYEIKPAIESISTDFQIPSTLEEALFVTIPGLRQSLLEELMGKTLALIDEVKYDMNANTAEGTVSQRLTKLQADYIAATESLANYALTSELSTAHIAQDYLIDRFLNIYLQEREGWLDTNGANWLTNEAIVKGRMAAQAEYDANSALVTSAKDVADRDYPLSGLQGKLAWSADGSYTTDANGTSSIKYADSPPAGLSPVWKIYTAITSQDIYDKSVRVENQQASYSEDIRAFADNQRAYASITTSLEATSGENTAKIDTVAGVMVGDIKYYLIDYAARNADGSQDPQIGDVVVFTSTDNSYTGSVVTDVNNIKDKQDRLEYTGTVTNPPITDWDGWEKTLKSSVSGAFDVTAVKINALQAQVDQQIDSWFQDGTPMHTSSDVDAAHMSNSTTVINLVTNDLVWDVNALVMYKFVAPNEIGVNLSTETYPTANRWDVVYKEPEATWRATDVTNGNTGFTSVVSEVYKHKSDLYYDNTSGAAYRYTKNDQATKYEWKIITDTALTKAMADAATAQSSADGSMKFYTGATAPDRTYGTNAQMMGDVWVPSANSSLVASDGATYNVGKDVEYVWQDVSGVWKWVVSSTANRLNSLLAGTLNADSIQVGGQSITTYVSDSITTGTDHMLDVYTGSPKDTVWIERMQNGSNSTRGDLFISVDSNGVTTTYSLVYAYHPGELDASLTTPVNLVTNETVALKDSVQYLYVAANESSKDLTAEDFTNTGRWVTITSRWKEVKGASNVKALKDLSDGKRTIYTTGSNPELDSTFISNGSVLNEGDVWIPSADTTIGTKTYITGHMYYYTNGSWSEPTVLTDIRSRLATQEDRAFNILHQTSSDLKAPYNNTSGPRIYDMLHKDDEQANGVKYPTAEIGTFKVLAGDLWECSVSNTTTIAANGTQMAIPIFSKGTTYVLTFVVLGTYIASDGSTLPNEYAEWKVANEGMTKLAKYSEKNSTIHGGHVAPTLVDKTVALTPTTAHTGDMWIPNKYVLELTDNTLVTFKIDKTNSVLWTMNTIEPVGSLTATQQIDVLHAIKNNVATSIGIVKYKYGITYIIDSNGVWSESMSYTNDDYVKKVVNGEVALGSDAKINVGGNEQTLLKYVHDTAYNTINLYNGTKEPGRHDEVLDGKLRFEGVAQGDIYAWHTHDTATVVGTTLAVEVGYEYVNGTLLLNSALPTPNQNRTYADVTYDPYDTAASTSQLLMKTYVIAKRAGDLLTGAVEAYWIRTDAKNGVVSATIKDFADTTFGRLEDLKDGKRTIVVADWINTNYKAMVGSIQVDTSKLMDNDALIVSVGGVNPDTTNIPTWVQNDHYYIKDAAGEYVAKYRPLWSNPTATDKYTKTISNGEISFAIDTNGDYYKVVDEYDEVSFVTCGSKNANSIFGSEVTSIVSTEPKYKYYESGEIHYWSGSSWVSTAVASRKKIPHWAAGTSNFTTDPTTGAITGWSYTDGSDHSSEFVIKADKFMIEGSGTSSDTATPFSVVVGDPTATPPIPNKVKFDGVVEFSNISGGESIVTADQIFTKHTTTIDGGKITAGSEISAPIINGGSITGNTITGGTITGVNITGSVIKSSWIDYTTSIGLTSWLYIKDLTGYDEYLINFAKNNNGTYVITDGYYRLPGTANITTTALGNKETLAVGDWKFDPLHYYGKTGMALYGFNHRYNNGASGTYIFDKESSSPYSNSLHSIRERSIKGINNWHKIEGLYAGNDYTTDSVNRQITRTATYQILGNGEIVKFAIPNVLTFGDISISMRRTVGATVTSRVFNYWTYKNEKSSTGTFTLLGFPFIWETDSSSNLTISLDGASTVDITLDGINDGLEVMLNVNDAGINFYTLDKLSLWRFPSLQEVSHTSNWD